MSDQIGQLSVTNAEAQLAPWAQRAAPFIAVNSNLRASPFVVRYRTTNGNPGVRFALRYLRVNDPDFSTEAASRETAA